MAPNAQERVEAFKKTMADAKANLARLELMQEEIRQIESVETSPDRSVTVVAGPSGAVRSITFTDAALTQGPAALSRLTTTTFQQAVAKAARLQAEIVQRYAGDKVDIVNKVNKIQEELANPPEPQDGFQLTKDSQSGGGFAFNEDQAMEQQSARPASPPPAPQQPGFGQPPVPPRGMPGMGAPAPQHAPMSPPPFQAPPRRPEPARAQDANQDYEEWNPLISSTEPNTARPASNPQRQAPPRRPASDAPEDDSYDFHLE